MGAQLVSTALPILPKETNKPVEPEAIIERRVIYKHEAPLIQILVKWQDNSSDYNTWEYLPDLLKQFLRASSLLNISRGQEIG